MPDSMLRAEVMGTPAGTEHPASLQVCPEPAPASLAPGFTLWNDGVLRGFPPEARERIPGGERPLCWALDSPLSP